MVGVLSEAHREREKTTSEKCKASMRALSFCLVGFAHTRRMHAVQNEACKKGTGPTTAGAHQASRAATEQVGLDR